MSLICQIRLHFQFDIDSIERENEELKHKVESLQEKMPKGKGKRKVRIGDVYISVTCNIHAHTIVYRHLLNSESRLRV